jgi:hypothetical protein
MQHDCNVDPLPYHPQQRTFSAASAMSVISQQRTLAYPRLAVNKLVSVDFTSNAELTVFRHQTVGRFYNPDSGPIPLTTVIGLRARVNRVGMEIAWQGVVVPMVGIILDRKCDGWVWRSRRTESIAQQLEEHMLSNIKRMAVALATATIVGVVGMSAQATPFTINFESEPFGAIAGGTLVVPVPGGTITITGTGLQIRSLPPAFTPAFGLKHLSTLSDIQPITFALSAGLIADSVSIINPVSGVSSGEIDTIMLEAFNAAAMSIGSTTSSATMISIVVPGIASVVTDDVGSTGYVIDEITFDLRALAVPEPGTLALFGLGLAGLGVARGRKKAA